MIMEPAFVALQLDGFPETLSCICLLAVRLLPNPVPSLFSPRVSSSTTFGSSPPNSRQQASEQYLQPGVPLPPAAACRLYRALLTTYELREVHNYAAVYFAGQPGCRKVSPPQPSAQLGSANDCNGGYDDEAGDYRLVVGDHIAYRYQILSLLGEELPPPFACLFVCVSVCRCRMIVCTSVCRCCMVADRWSFHGIACPLGNQGDPLPCTPHRMVCSCISNPGLNKQSLGVAAD